MSNTRNLRRQCLTSFLELDEESHHLSPKYLVKKTAPKMGTGRSPLYGSPANAQVHFCKCESNAVHGYAIKYLIKT
ncbi:MAG: hypothetical protein C0469_13250 [Cyanobacteria bacterium DS2.3.42]|nr:hypothetical protein [Cyanobacteria bacterium DS2.3.42]